MTLLNDTRPGSHRKECVKRPAGAENRATLAAT